ncbi:unnamed protein product [Cuscuta europaea]|uniref:CMP/dCMP-type deaminase domain-containing protein n=1 Tax=Cuscuta europaea TaxID=41803 RepID=A0A9P0ZSQ6_CUSEU|nr:unnamed protein product [Cuscuta europaea]
MNMNGSDEADATSDCGWAIVHIPNKLPVLPHLQPTVKVYAAEVEPKDANALVRKLNNICPMENMRHVKRIRKKCLDGGKPQLSLILSVLMEGDSDMPSDVLELVKAYQLSTFIAKVCKYAASTKEEWEEQCKLWPTSFHPPTYNISGITGFNEAESQLVFSFMQLACNNAKSDYGLMTNAAIIVDPSTNKVIASACDEVISLNGSRNEVKEGISCSRQPEASPHYKATDMADQPKFPADDSSEKALSSLNDNNVSCLHPWKWVDHQFRPSLSSWHPLRHAAIVAIDQSSARDRRLFPTTVNNFLQEDCLLSPLVGCPLKKQRINPTDVNGLDDLQTVNPSESSRPYLCTGYDIYLVWEPCIMCAMALVHQRVRRIFYAFPNHNAGALGSVHRLQGERSLNHHYAVFRVLFPKDILDSETT